MFETLAARVTRVTLSRVANASVTLPSGTYRVRWDESYDDGFGVSTKEPRVTFLDEDGAVLAENTLVTKGAVVYKIRTIEPDGMGLTVCTLLRNA